MSRAKLQRAKRTPRYIRWYNTHAQLLAELPPKAAELVSAVAALKPAARREWAKFANTIEPRLGDLVLEAVA